jgi:type I restriction enzyme R subunit
MSSQTNEEILESHIEKALLALGFYKGENKDLNKEYAIDEKRFLDFLETTQKEEL